MTHAAVGIRGRVALVTGGARRVGAELVRMLAQQGARIGVHYWRSGPDAERLVHTLRSAGVEALALQADLRHETQVERLFRELDERLGPVEILVNNASTYERSALRDTTLQSWERVLQTNLSAPFLCCRAACTRMIPAGGGQIVNVADLAGLQAWPEHGAHCASKAGLVALTRCLARELAPRVRVNALAPGLVLRGDDQALSEWERLTERIPRGRPGQPADVAAALRFLLSTPTLSGLVLPVDGGRLAGSAWVPGPTRSAGGAG